MAVEEAFKSSVKEMHKSANNLEEFHKEIWTLLTAQFWEFSLKTSSHLKIIETSLIRRKQQV